MSRIYCVTELRQHVYNLGKAFNVEIEESPERPLHQSFMDVRYHEKTCEILSRCAQIRTVASEVEYAIALHELGHALHPNGMILQRRSTHSVDVLELPLELKVYQERCAYEWAHQNALIWTPLMDLVEEAGMASHTGNFTESAIRGFALLGLLLPPHVPVRATAPAPSRPTAPRRTESIKDFLQRTQR